MRYFFLLATMLSFKKAITFLFFTLLSSYPLLLSAQAIMGTTGLLTLPNAEMQPDKTVMLGVNYLNREITPDIFNYHTLNYYLNVTILPCLEVAYTCTLFKATDIFKPHKKGRFVNQDRAFSFRFRPLKEGKYYPAFVIGWNDINPKDLKKKQVLTSNSTNRFFGGLYMAATKHIAVHQERIGFHLAYTYTRRTDARLKDVSFGIDYVPSFFPSFRLIGEVSKDEVNAGASCVLFRHLMLHALLEKGRYFSGGVGYKLYL